MTPHAALGFACLCSASLACTKVPHHPDRDPPANTSDAEVEPAAVGEDPESSAADDESGGKVVDASAEEDAGPSPLRHQARFPCADDRFATSMVDVGELNLQVACQGSGPAIVFLHGYPELHLAWTELAAPLAAAGFRVIAPDQRGYNLSDKPNEVDAYLVDHLVSDLEGLIEASGERQVLLVGHDWGGLVAFVYAHRHPERLRGLVVMNGPHPDIWGHPEVDSVQAQASANYVPLVSGPLADFALGFVELQLGPHLSPAERDAYHAAWGQPDVVASMSKWFQANLEPEVRLPTGVTITTPTLVLWGLDDSFVTASQLDHLPDYVEHLQVKRFAGVDHWITHQISDELLHALRDFEASLRWQD
ncbi:MAG: alpha/beta hydrolase [Myxococcales bacterium]